MDKDRLKSYYEESNNLFAAQFIFLATGLAMALSKSYLPPETWPMNRCIDSVAVSSSVLSIILGLKGSSINRKIIAELKNQR